MGVNQANSLTNQLQKHHISARYNTHGMPAHWVRWCKNNTIQNSIYNSTCTARELVFIQQLLSAKESTRRPTILLGSGLPYLAKDVGRSRQLPLFPALIAHTSSAALKVLDLWVEFTAISSTRVTGCTWCLSGYSYVSNKRVIMIMSNMVPMDSMCFPHSAPTMVLMT